MTIELDDRINRWVFFPQDFVSELDPLLDITRSFQFQSEAEGRRFESANLSKLMEPYPDEVHRLGVVKAAAKLEKYKVQNVDKPYEYKGYVECAAQAITSIDVSGTTLTLAIDPDLVLPNPAHVSIEMVTAPGAQYGKNVKNAVKDLLARAFGSNIIEP